MAVRVLPRAVLLALLALAGGRSAHAGLSLQDRMVVAAPFEFGAGSVLFSADVDGDGWDDLVRSVPGRALFDSCWADGRRLRWDARLDSAGVLQQLADATGDGRPDLLVVAPWAGGYVLTCHDPWSPTGLDVARWVAGPFLQRCRVFDKQGVRGAVRVMGVFDGDGDGSPEVYVQVEPFVPGVEGRRLVCFDGATGRAEWETELAGHMTRLLLLRGTATRLVFGTHSPGNGFVAHGEDDRHCYVTGLSPSGHRLWSWEMGGTGCAVILAAGDLVGGVDEEVVLTTDVASMAPRGLERGERRLLVLDPSDGTMLDSTWVGSDLMQLTSVSLDGNSRHEVLSVDRDGRLRCHGHDLVLRWEGPRRGAREVVGVADMDRDARPEILCSTGSALRVLDGRGRLRADWRVAGGWLQAVLVRTPRSAEVAVASNAGGCVLALEPPAVPPAGVAAAGVILLTGGAWTGYWVHRRRRASALVEANDARERLLEAMLAFGHSGSSLGVLHRLQFHLRNWARVREEEAGRRTTSALLDDLEDSVIPAMVRLVALARRAQMRPTHWAPLAKQALVVSAEMHELLDGRENLEGHRHRAMAALDQMDACLAGLRAHLRQQFRTPLEPVLRRLWVRHAGAMAVEHVDMRLEAEDVRALAVYIAPDQLDGLLDNLLENARRAMQGSLQRSLTVLVSRDGGACRLDVSDTGCGIPLQDHERVFDRDYTTREGGGFGLYHARQVLARYEGRIFVARSAPGEGATFRMVLRMA